ncbi:ATP-binding protein [Heyndrickxia sp. FSL W8-0423]
MDRIELILSELLILAKPQDLKFERENLSSLIEEVKTLIDTQAIMNNVQIYILNEYQDLVVKCDRNQLKQVFINFLKNAIEAMPEGGIVTIEIKKLGTNKLKIFFKDTGIGIPQSILKRIGEPFFTTKENGTGLGIMISKQIIENHNGTVHFWSDKKGTMIEVILPIDNKQ